MSPDSVMEDEMRMRVVSGLKEKNQNPFNFFQHSRNAIMGAADAVRRVAAKGAFGDDNRRTETLVATVDGMIWTGCSNGVLLQWDGNGNRLHEFQHHASAIQSLCTVGSHIWVGYMSGTLQVLDLNGDLRGEWVAHNSPVIDLTVGAGYVFSLANHGGIRGWNITSPAPLDNLFRSSAKEFSYTKLENLKILAGTWNVGQGRASPDFLISWLGSAAADIDIIVVGLQEVEMGAGFLAVSAAKETGAVGLRMRVYGRVMCFVNCHFAAHLDAVNRRNADFDHVYRTMIFSRPSNLLNAAAAGVSSAIHMLRSTNGTGVNSEEGIPELSEADMVVFLGDFNYRLHGISYDEARDLISQRSFDWLREMDQLQAEMKAGNVFQGLREAVIRFPPTYKFNIYISCILLLALSLIWWLCHDTCLK